MTPARLREYVLIITRDVAPVVTGMFLCFYLPMSGNFEPWQLPLLAGLFGVPLVAPRGREDGEPPTKELP